MQALSQAGPLLRKVEDWTSDKRIAIIGSGYSGLAAALELRSLGYGVVVFEKLSQPGGRAQRTAPKEGFVHDAGPSWYWMPEVFDEVLRRYGEVGWLTTRIGAAVVCRVYGLHLHSEASGACRSQ